MPLAVWAAFFFAPYFVSTSITPITYRDLLAAHDGNIEMKMHIYISKWEESEPYKLENKTEREGGKKSARRDT